VGLRRPVSVFIAHAAAFSRVACALYMTQYFGVLFFARCRRVRYRQRVARFAPITRQAAECF